MPRAAQSISQAARSTSTGRESTTALRMAAKVATRIRTVKLTVASVARPRAVECGLAAAQEQLITPRWRALKPTVVTRALAATDPNLQVLLMVAVCIASVTLRSPTPRSTWQEPPAAAAAIRSARPAWAVTPRLKAVALAAARSSPTVEA